ncbi:MAG: hypothetical protein FJZ59_01875 [Chlamydiae bacterium]|nr:hypothetical protein [Chlamydiota bacterium]
MDAIRKSSLGVVSYGCFTKTAGVALSAVLVHAVFAGSLPVHLKIGDTGPLEFDKVVNDTLIEFGKDIVCRELAEGIVIADQVIVDHADCEKAEELIVAYDFGKSDKIAEVRDRLLRGYRPKNEHARNIHALVTWIESSQAKHNCYQRKSETKLQRRPDCHSRYKGSYR